MVKNNNTNIPFPQWTEQIYNENTGEDFLGLRSVSTNITTYLLPGIITITPRARYYSFYCWLLREYDDNHPKGTLFTEFIKRREQIFALANLAFDKVHSYGDSTTGMMGSTKLEGHLEEHQNDNMIPLTVDDYLAASYGGFGQYRGVMRNLDLMKDSDDPKYDQVLLPNSKRLANGYAMAIKNTEYYKNRHYYDTASSISIDCLKEYGRHCYLSGLAAAEDAKPILNVLFGFDAKEILPNPDFDISTHGNMCGSMGLILEMINQSQQMLSDYRFRDFLLYGFCSDFPKFQPSPQLYGFLAHWQIFQIRELYVYALYELWIYFLDYLRGNGPFDYNRFSEHLENISFKESNEQILSFSSGNRSFSEISTISMLDMLLSQSGVSEGKFQDRCIKYARKYHVIVNESLIFDLLNKPPNELTRKDRFILSTMMLLGIYIRLKGIKQTDPYDAWYWAREGGVRRRSMEIFVRQMDEQIVNEASLLDTLDWIFRDYIIAQHTITSLEKWHQRKANTFHFNFENGIFEWVQMDSNSLSASRFSYAYNMIRDLGLVRVEENEVPSLSERGKKTLKRVLDKLEESYE